MSSLSRIMALYKTRRIYRQLLKTCNFEDVTTEGVNGFYHVAKVGIQSSVEADGTSLSSVFVGIMKQSYT